MTQAGYHIVELPENYRANPELLDRQAEWRRELRVTHPQLVELLESITSTGDAWRAYNTYLRWPSAHAATSDVAQLARELSRLYQHTTVFFDVAEDAARLERPDDLDGFTSITFVEGAEQQA